MIGESIPKRPSVRSVVFDRARAASNNPEVTALGGSEAIKSGLGLHFRVTDRDRQPPREILTGKLLGDPTPGRTVPRLPPEQRQGYREPEPAPIYLTFRDYEAALADGTYGERGDH